MVHLVGYLGWVDFDFGCFAICLALLDGELAELAEQVEKLVEHQRSESSKSNYPTRWATLYNEQGWGVS